MTTPKYRFSDTRIRVFAVAGILAALVWSIAPGKIQPDTKFDLLANPWGYLARALYAWNDHAALGELQNQAYGYLFPMGAVFGIADSIGLSPWVSQRVWWMILLLVTFLGAHRLAIRLGGFSSDLAIVVALIYALSPRLLSVLSEISIEAWPAAIAPWLVLAAHSMLGPKRTTRELLRGAALTALLSSALGGVNATASLAVLILPFLFLLLGSKASRGLVALAWWFPSVIAGSAWWLIPLLILGRYGYPFLDYIETSRITTAVTSLANSLRGADHWISYILDSQGHPVWQGGWVQSQYVVAIVTGLGVVALAFFGLMRMRTDSPGSHLVRFLYVSLFLGLGLVSLGYGGAMSSPFSSMIRTFLDGPGAPLRNVHKFDPLIRLPIAFGFGYGCLALLRSPRQFSRAVLVLASLAAIVSPTALWVGRTGDANAITATPAVWLETAEVVDSLAASDGGGTLVLPHARTADMAWGKVTDEPLSVLAKSPIAVRAAAPLGNPGGTRILDRIDVITGTGQGSNSLAQTLARMGISRVVVRGDVSEAVLMHDARQVERSLMASDGFELIERISEDISIWRISEAQGGSANLYDANELITVDGVAEDTVDLLESGRLGIGTPSEVVPQLDSAMLRTDRFRWAIWNSGHLPAWGTGELLTVSDERPQGIGARQLPPDHPASEHAVRAWKGVTNVSASSSASDPFGELLLGSGFSPAAAIDGSVNTSWWSEPERESWYQLEFEQAQTLGQLTVQMATAAQYRLPKSLSFSVDGSAKSRTITVPIDPEGVAKINLSGEAVKRLRLAFPATTAKTVTAIAEITSDRLNFGSQIELPGAIDLSQTKLELHAESSGLGARLVGRAFVARTTEDAHRQSWRFTSTNSGDASLHVRVRVKEGADFELLLDGAHFESRQRVSAQSDTRPGVAFDRDDATSWVVPAGVDEATVSVRLEEGQDVDRIILTEPAQGIRIIDGSRVERLGSGGGKLNRPLTEFDLIFARPDSVGADESWAVPETHLVGYTVPKNEFSSPCDAVKVQLNGVDLTFRLRASRRDMAAAHSLSLEPCGSAEAQVTAGNNELSISTPPWLLWNALSVGADDSLATAPKKPRETISLTRTNPTQLSAQVESERKAIIVLPQGFNSGWIAQTAEGALLPAMVVDGWQQGFIVPEGQTGAIEFSFAPQRAHAWGLLTGPLVAILALAALILTRGSRRRNNGEADNAEGEVRHTDARASVIRMLVLPAGLVLGVGFVFSSWQGMLLGAFVLLIPVTWLEYAVAGVLAASGFVLSAFGVVDHASLGALLGQTMALFAVLALLRWWFVSVPTPESVSRGNTTIGSQSRGLP